MNFIDRTSLGDKLASRLEQFHGKDAVILCLQESSLLTCLTIAKQIHAWVHPLMYEPVFSADHARTLLGAFNQDGEFCPMPADDPEADSELTTEMKAAVKKQKPAAMEAIQKQIDSYGMELDKHRLDGRDVILACDILTSPLPLVVAQHLLKDVSPKSLAAVIGNTTPEVAQLVRISAGQADILDILSGVVYDDGHYFEHADTYTPEQKHTLTQHIAAYWQ
jgi:predicted phosphoribosyltransferase